jgi:hypothetical protein
MLATKTALRWRQAVSSMDWIWGLQPYPWNHVLGVLTENIDGHHFQPDGLEQPTVVK